MLQEFSRPGASAVVWLDELPEWAAFVPAGFVESYWHWRGTVPSSASGASAAWGYSIVLGGKAEGGVLGAVFNPHDYPHLRIRIASTTEPGATAPRPFPGTRVGLDLEYVGGVLAGAFQEPALLGPGTLTFRHAATHEVDSSWEAFRVLALGVVRLIALSGANEVPPDLLPRFGGLIPDSPGSV